MRARTRSSRFTCTTPLTGILREGSSAGSCAVWCGRSSSGRTTSSKTQIVGIVLVHNEDVFVERAIRNVAAFCDRLHAVDHVSTDGTWEILQRLEREYDHLDARRVRHARQSHQLVEPYAGTNTWVFGVDGDE